MKFTLAFATLVVLVGLCQAASFSKRSPFARFSQKSLQARGKSYVGLKRNLLSEIAKRQGGGGGGGPGNGGGGPGNGGGGPGNGGGGSGGEQQGEGASGDHEGGDPSGDHEGDGSSSGSAGHDGEGNKCYDDEKGWLAWVGYSAMRGKCNTYAYLIMQSIGVDEYNDDTKAEVDAKWHELAVSEDGPWAPLMHATCEHVWDATEDYDAADEEEKAEMRQTWAHMGYTIACTNGVADLEQLIIYTYPEEDEELYYHLYHTLMKCKPVFDHQGIYTGYDWMYEEEEPEKRQLYSLLEQLKRMISKKQV